MVTAQELLSYELKILQRIQHLLNLAINAASSHDLKTKLCAHLTKTDMLESQVQILCEQRGWEPMDLEPATKWWLDLRFRHKTDTDIAEHLIRLYTSEQINLMKHYNVSDHSDAAIRVVVQKFFDYSTFGIHQLHPFL